MSIRSHKDDHSLYHEAKSRTSRPQPIKRYTEGGSLLLLAPNNIIFELFGTIVKEIPSDRLLDFITNSLVEFLDSSWDNKITQQIFKRLKREQAVDIRAGLKDIPTIRHSPTSSPPQRKPTSPTRDQQTSRERSGGRESLSGRQKSPPLSYTPADNRQKAIKQIYEHVMWRIRTENVTQITSLLAKLALDDGYKRGKLKAEVYEDVARNFEEWRSKLLIKLYAFGDAPANDQKLILSNTGKGDLTKWLANYIDGSEKRQNLDLLRKLASALRDRTKNCIYLTHDLKDGLQSLQTDSIRLVLIVDRTKQYEPLESVIQQHGSLQFLMSAGKLYIISSLDCVRFAPDPTSISCC